MKARAITTLAVAFVLLVPGASRAAPSFTEATTDHSCTTNPADIVRMHTVDTADCATDATADFSSGRMQGHVEMTTLNGGTLPGFGGGVSLQTLGGEDFIAGPVDSVTYTFHFHVTSATLVERAGTPGLFDSPNGGAYIGVEAFPNCEDCNGAQAIAVLVDGSIKSVIDDDVDVSVVFVAPVGHGIQDAPVVLHATVVGSGYLGNRFDVGAGSIVIDTDVTLLGVTQS